MTSKGSISAARRAVRMDLMLRIIRIVVSPRDEWERIAADGWLPALTYISVLSLLPTFASFVNVRNSELALPPNAVLMTYFASAFGVLMIAAAFWLLVEDGVVAAVGEGVEPEADAREDLGGAVVTPGLVNTHHHLYQTLTRARAQEADLFTWLKTLYPIWGQVDEEAEHAAARTGLAELALSGCSTVFDHHYVFPSGSGDLVEAEMSAARELGVRLIPSRGSMDLGESDGGLPPDELVEELFAPDMLKRAADSRAAEAGASVEAVTWLGEDGDGHAVFAPQADAVAVVAGPDVDRHPAQTHRRRLAAGTGQHRRDHSHHP